MQLLLLLIVNLIQHVEFASDSAESSTSMFSVV